MLAYDADCSFIVAGCSNRFHGNDIVSSFANAFKTIHFHLDRAV